MIIHRFFMSGMIKGILKYWDLGRSKAKGQIKIIAKDEEDFNKQMDREFGKHLMSSDISFGNGNIYAGFHCVGKFNFMAEIQEVAE